MEGCVWEAWGEGVYGRHGVRVCMGGMGRGVYGRHGVRVCMGGMG